MHRRLLRGPADQSLLEGPWQLAEAGEWDRLAELIGSPELVEPMHRERQEDFQRLWTRVEAASHHRAAALLGKPPPEDADRRRLEEALVSAEVLRGRDELTAAAGVSTAIVGNPGAEQVPRVLVSALVGLAEVKRLSGDGAEVLPLLERHDAIAAEKLDDGAGLQESLGLRGGVCSTHRDAATRPWSCLLGNGSSRRRRVTSEPSSR